MVEIDPFPQSHTLASLQASLKVSKLDMLAPDVVSIILSFLTYHEIRGRVAPLSWKWHNTLSKASSQIWRSILMNWSIKSFQKRRQTMEIEEPLLHHFNLDSLTSCISLPSKKVLDALSSQDGSMAFIHEVMDKQSILRR